MTMNSTPWSAYSQHYSRLVGTANPSAGSLTQGTSLNELTLSASLPRQEHMGGYGSTTNAHHLLLSSHPGINPSQTSNRSDSSFNTAGLFGTNYDPSVFCAPFQASAKNHLSSFSQGGNFYKAVNRESDFSDLRGGFMHCNVASNPMNPDGNPAIPTGSGLSSSVLFNSPMASGTWRHSAVMPSSCGPFGILPHEAIMSRNHLMERGSDKMVSQSAKASRTSLTAASFLEQDINSGYRTVLPSPSRPPSSFLDAGGSSHPMLTPQSDPYLTSVNESYFSSASKSNFQAYGTFGANLHNPVSRSSSVTPYFYPQSYSFGTSADKGDSSVSSNASVTSNTNFVPNTGVIVNPMQVQNGQSLRQSVISKSSSNPSNNSHIVQSQHNNGYGQNLYYFGSVSQEEPLVSRSTPQSLQIQGFENVSSSQTVSVGQMPYPPMSTPAPASTPSNPAPPVSIGQAYVPGPVGHSQDGLSNSSVTQYGDIYSSPPTSAATYSASGTHPSTPASPRKPESLQHTPQPSCSVEHSNLDVDSSQYVDSVHLSAHEEEEKCIEEIVNTSLQSSIQPCESHQSTKILHNEMTIVAPNLISPNSTVHQHKSLSITDMLPMHVENTQRPKSRIEINSVFDDQTMPMNLSVLDAIASQSNGNYMQQSSQCQAAPLPVGDVYDLPESLTPPPPEPRKHRSRGRRGNKRKQPLNKLFTFGVAKYKPYSETLVSIVKSKETKQNRSKAAKKEARAIRLVNSYTKNSILSLDTGTTNTENGTLNNTPVTNEEQIVNFIEFSHPVAPQPGWNFTRQNSEASGKLSEIVQNHNNKASDSTTPNNNDTSGLQNSKNKDGAVDDDLGFLTDLQPTSDGEKNDAVKCEEKNKVGFFQNFLSFLEDPPAGTDHEKKIMPKKRNKIKSKQLCSKLGTELTSLSDLENRKEWLLNGDTSTKKKDADDDDGEEHFGETASLDASLFGSTLQKEVIVPNPEAPSFSSDEEDNSSQGLADTVAMAIRRLCDEYEQAGPSCSHQNAPESKESEEDNKSNGRNCFLSDRPAERIDEKNFEETSPENNEGIPEDSLQPLKKEMKQRKSKGDNIFHEIRKKKAEISEEEKEEVSWTLSDTESQGSKKKLIRKCKSKLSVQGIDSPDNQNKTWSEKLSDEDNMRSFSTNSPQSLVPFSHISISETKEQRQPVGNFVTSNNSTNPTEEMQKVTTENANSDRIACKVILTKEKHSTKSKTKKEKLLKGHFRIGDYITLHSELRKKCPPIWRIESKTILQRFEVFEQNGRLLYRNTSSFSAWRPSSKSKFTPLIICLIEDTKDKVIIERLSSTDQEENDYGKGIDIDDSATHPLRENFEVFLQTLVSQVLDPSFINEIVKENDKYFLSHLQEIEDVMQERKEALLRWSSWNSQLRRCAETYPNMNIVPCSEKGKTRCQGCHGKVGRHVIHFSGQLYNYDTMEPRLSSVNSSTTSVPFSLCSSCVTVVTLFSHVYHHKYHFFHKCCSRVDRAREADEKKESHAILEECLQDTDWIAQMFHEMENLWDACDSLR